MASCTWVCVSCAQHFTRRYTANRHSTNLHDGKGIIVRILDYIVGRVSGQYIPKDPLAYRRERQNEKNEPSLDSHYKKKNFWSKVIADSTNDIISERSKTSLLPKNRIESSYPDLLSQPRRKSDNKGSIGDPVQESIRTNLKSKNLFF